MKKSELRHLIREEIQRLDEGFKARIDTGGEKYTPDKTDEIWYSDDDLIVYFHPQNNTLHFTDKDTGLKIFSSVHAKDREHAKKHLQKRL